MTWSLSTRYREIAFRIYTTKIPYLDFVTLFYLNTLGLVFNGTDVYSNRSYLTDAVLFSSFQYYLPPLNALSGTKHGLSSAPNPAATPPSSL
jgi:hypothetical protein